jgi:predicted N-acetyltransferase YhbS
MITFRLMTADDIRSGMQLSGQVGWNQTTADWQRALSLEPKGCFVAEEGGVTVGTVTTCVFDSVGWIAMVIVSPSLRGRGIGKALMNQALHYLEEQGVRSVRLDATELGRPMYEKLGFQAQFELIRYQGIMPASRPVKTVENAEPKDLGWILEMDLAVTASNRRKLLSELLIHGQEPTRLVRDRGTGKGFLMARRGAKALHLGPCIATGDAGPVLFADACSRYAGTAVFVDIPIPNTTATQVVQGWGLTPQRPLVRMFLGQPVCEEIDGLWASSGPEKG